MYLLAHSHMLFHGGRHYCSVFSLPSSGYGFSWVFLVQTLGLRSFTETAECTGLDDFETFCNFIKDHFDLLTFRAYIISTFEIFVPGHFDSRTFWFYVNLTIGLFDPILFRPLDISITVISNFKHFVLLSVR